MARFWNACNGVENGHLRKRERTTVRADWVPAFAAMTKRGRSRNRERLALRREDTKEVRQGCGWCERMGSRRFVISPGKTVEVVEILEVPGIWPGYIH